MGRSVVVKKGKSKPAEKAAVTTRHPKVVALLRDMGPLAEVAPTPAHAGGKARTAVGGELNEVKNAEVFLTCGDAAGTLPSRDPCDRAHAWKPTGMLSRGDRVGRASLARRYPPSALNSAGLSCDSQEDALFARQSFLRDLGVAGYGGESSDDDARKGVAVYDAFFGGREKGSVRAALRWYGTSKVMKGVGG